MICRRKKHLLNIVGGLSAPQTSHYSKMCTSTTNTKRVRFNPGTDVDTMLDLSADKVFESILKPENAEWIIARLKQHREIWSVIESYVVSQRADPDSTGPVAVQLLVTSPDVDANTAFNISGEDIPPPILAVINDSQSKADDNNSNNEASLVVVDDQDTFVDTLVDALFPDNWEDAFEGKECEEGEEGEEGEEDEDSDSKAPNLSLELKWVCRHLLCSLEDAESRPFEDVWRNIDKKGNMDSDSFKDLVEESVYSWAQDWIDNLTKLRDRLAEDEEKNGRLKYEPKPIGTIIFGEM